MMFVTSKHVFEIKKCHNFLKDNDLLSAVSTFWFHNSKAFLRGLLNVREKQILTSVAEIQKKIGDNHAFFEEN